jgi:hypothetical protein
VLDDETLAGLHDWTAVYRAYDKAGVLLYVGKTRNPSFTGGETPRFREHADKRWFLRAAVITIEWYPSEAEALEIEERAIASGHPTVNRRARGTPRAYTLPPPKPRRPRPPAHRVPPLDEAMRARLLALIGQGTTNRAAARELLGSDGGRMTVQRWCALLAADGLVRVVDGPGAVRGRVLTTAGHDALTRYDGPRD